MAPVLIRLIGGIHFALKYAVGMRRRPAALRPRVGLDGMVPPDSSLSGVFVGESPYKVRTYKGRLVGQKDPRDTRRLADRISKIQIDVLAVQEVEHIGMLQSFNRDMLGGLYQHLVLIEGNDQRLLDVGILSMLPIGPVTTHQTAVHKDEPRQRVFSRDLLQAEIRNHRGDKLFNVYNWDFRSTL